MTNLRGEKVRTNDCEAESIERLKQIVAAATEHASVALTKWTKGRVTLAINEIRDDVVEVIWPQLNVSDELQTVVALGIEGSAEGQIVLIFDEVHGRELANCLVGRESRHDGEWDDVEQSAVMETGNIFCSAYLSELSRQIEQDFRPSPPLFLQDFGASVVEQALMVQAMHSDRVVVCESRFEFNQKVVDWSVLFVPSVELIESIERVSAGASVV